MKLGMCTIVFALGVGSASCSKDDAAPTTAAVSDDAKQEAQVIFQSRCAVCHGAQGRGDGAAAMSLNPRPRDYSDKAWQAQVTDDELKRVILRGGAAANKSRMMPASPDLDNKPEVVSALVEIIRGFGK